MFNFQKMLKINRFSSLFFFCFVILFISLIRFINLNSDPHSIVYRDVITDEGWFTQNARNHYLFNDWVLDEHNPAYILCPIYTFAERFIFSLFGNTLYSSRILSAVSLSLVCILIIVRFFKNRNIALLVTLLVVSNPYLFFYSRTAFVESFQLLAITCTWYFSSFQKSKKILFLRFLSGVFAAIAVFIKPSAGIIIMFAVFSPWAANLNKRFNEKAKESLFVVCGGLLIIVFMLPFFLSEIELFFIEFSRESSLISIENGFNGLATPLYYGLVKPWESGNFKLPGYNLVFVPILFLLTILAFSRSNGAKTSKTGNNELDYIVRTSVLWLIFIQISFFSQSTLHIEPRYWINMFIPISIILIIKLFGINNFKNTYYRLSKISAIFGIFLIIYILRPQTLQIFSNTFHIKSKFIITILLTTVIIFGSVILGLIAEKLLRKMRLNSQMIQLVSRSMVIIVILFWSMFGIISVFNSSFTLESAIVDINSIIGDGAVLTGGVANTLSIGSKRYAFVTRNLESMNMGVGIINDDWNEKGVTNIIETIEENGVKREQQTWLPYGTAIPIKTYNLLPDSKLPTGYRFKVLLSEWHK